MTFGALLFYRFAVKNSQIVFLVAAAQVLARVDCGLYLTLLMTVCRTVLCHDLHGHSHVMCAHLSSWIYAVLSAATSPIRLRVVYICGPGELR